MKLAIFGFGNVGRVLAKKALKTGSSVSIIADSSGLLLHNDLNFTINELNEIEKQKNTGKKLIDVELNNAIFSKTNSFFKNSSRSILKDLVLADCSSFKDANAYLFPAMEQGVPVAMANKEPLSSSIEIFDRLVKHRSLIRFETSVGAGLPVINTLRRLIDSGDKVHQIQGCLSGTLGYIFSELSDTSNSFSSIVKKAHSLGFTEPDPRDDLSGKDVARKVLILCRMLSYKLELEDISVTSLFPDDLKDLSITEFLQKISEVDSSFEKKKSEALERRSLLKYVANIVTSGKDIKVTVGVEEVPKDSEIGALKGTDNIVVFKTESYNTNLLTIKGPGAGLDVTAEGVLADCYELYGNTQYIDNKVDVKGEKNDDGDEIFKLSKRRRVTVGALSTQTILIDIREFYEKDDKQLPGRKGISLTKDQWKNLKSSTEKIDEAIDRLK